VDTQPVELAVGVTPGKAADVFANVIPVAKKPMTVRDAIVLLIINIFSSLRR
jgi:hypothetical protein